MEDTPQPEPQQSPQSPTQEKAHTGKKGSLRERIDQDRAARRQRRLEALRGPLPKILAAIVVALALLYVVRAPILRAVAVQGGDVGAWAVDRLAAMKDPGSFALFVAQLGKGQDSARFHHLVFLLGGRAQAPRKNAPVPPDDPDAIAWHTKVLTEALGSDDPATRRGGLRALLALRKRTWTRTEPTLAAAARLLDRTQDLRTRCHAALLFTYSPAPASLHPPLLAAALEDPSREVRRFAVEALGRTGAKTLARPLATALSDAAPEVRREAQLALVRLGAAVSFETLEGIYRSDRPAHRPAVVEAIAGLSDPRALRLLLEATREKHPGTRLAATKGLATRGGTQALAALQRALRDANSSVRLAAIDALAERKDGAAAVAAMIDALARHEGWEELRRLHQALIRHTGADVPAPVQSQERTWLQTIDAWERYRDSGGSGE